MIAPIRNTKKQPYLAGYFKRKICVLYFYTFSHAGKSSIKTSPHCFVVFYFVKNRCRCCCPSIRYSGQSSTSSLTLWSFMVFIAEHYAWEKMVTHKCKKFVNAWKHVCPPSTCKRGWSFAFKHQRVWAVNHMATRTVREKTTTNLSLVFVFFD